MFSRISACGCERILEVRALDDGRTQRKHGRVWPASPANMRWVESRKGEEGNVRMPDDTPVAGVPGSAMSQHFPILLANASSWTATRRSVVVIGPGRDVWDLYTVGTRPAGSAGFILGPIHLSAFADSPPSGSRGKDASFSSLLGFVSQERPLSR